MWSNNSLQQVINEVNTEGYQSSGEIVSRETTDDTEPQNIPERVENISISSDTTSEKKCWVCYGNEEDDTDAEWIHPCLCKGSTKWIHEKCLQLWIDSRQLESFDEAHCPQCKTKYIIEHSELGSFVLIINAIDQFLYMLGPLAINIFTLGCIYSSAVTYGALTVMQVCGHDEALSLMEKANPISLLVGLPTIPIGIFAIKMIRWEESILVFLRRNTSRIHYLGYIFPFFVIPEQYANALNTPPSSPDMRVILWNLLLPTCATLIGKLLFFPVKKKFYRSMLGGLVFIVAKGLVRIYQKQAIFINKCHRRIRSYPDT